MSSICSQYNNYKHNSIYNDIDNQEVLEMLQRHYNSTDYEELQFLVKEDLKDKYKFEELLTTCEKFSTEIFIEFLIRLFPAIFNKFLIKRIKAYLQ